MIRIYYLPIREGIEDSTVSDLEAVRHLLIRKQAFKFGLTLKLLALYPDTDETYDGDFTQVTRFLTQFMEWGMTNFRLSTSTRSEHFQLLDFYGTVPPVNAIISSPQMLRAQEADNQPDQKVMRARVAKGQALNFEALKRT